MADSENSSYSGGHPGSRSGLGRAPHSRDGLTVFRYLFFALTSASVLIAIITWLVVDDFTPEASWVLPLSVGLAIMSVVAAQAVMRTRIEAGDDKEFAAWYAKTFFLAFALCDSPYLFAFVLSFMHGAFLPMLVVLPGHLIAMFSIGPTSRSLASLQSRVTASGSTVDVVQALRSNPRPLQRPGEGDGTIGV